MYYVTAKTIPKIGGMPERILLFAKDWQELEGEGRFLVDKDGFNLLKTDVNLRGCSARATCSPRVWG
ncbi:MAG: hypothetical protein SWH61_01885 [Thermodesulfobacteriota bacterium]|nr:hypothetical protein [Thermodesulfobacteriota bacterium]